LPIKELTLPQRLILTEILKKYLNRSHPKYPILEKDLAKRWAGYWGERALANYGKELPQEKYLILHGLELKLGRHLLPNRHSTNLQNTHPNHRSQKYHWKLVL